MSTVDPTEAKAITCSCALLIVDDDWEMAQTLQELLQTEGYAVEIAHSASEALTVQERTPHLTIALIDLIMPDMNGIALMAELRRRSPDLAVVIMTGYGTIENAVEAIKQGAEDYLTKPFDHEAVCKKVARLAEVFELRQRVLDLAANREPCLCLQDFIAMSPPMQRVLERARRAAASNVPVLVLGESGTGKEMLARGIHASSPRAHGPFVPVNCGALPHELVESELFGYCRGAFTGAHLDRAGVFGSACGGTVFLDEIGELPKEGQVKLLRALQEGEVRPLGSPRPVQVDVRIICASNRPLAALRNEYLRADLYFRIAGVVIELPPLRARGEDILRLTQHFADRLSRHYGRRISLARSAHDFLLHYPFPGNVRELENLLESTVALSFADPQVISDKEFKLHLHDQIAVESVPVASEQVFSMERLERFAIQQALRLSQGNRTKAASLLGISRDTLYRKLKEFANAS